MRIDHAVAPGHGELSRFTPEGYAFLSAASLDRTVQVASLRGAATIDLGRGLAFEMEGTGRTAKPVVDDQLWMAPWDGRVRLSLRRAFFSGDLRIEGFARGAISGPRSTPYGTIASGDRYDAGVSAQVDELSIFVVLLNLENEYAPAADYEGGLSGSVGFGLVDPAPAHVPHGAHLVFSQLAAGRLRGPPRRADDPDPR